MTVYNVLISMPRDNSIIHNSTNTSSDVFMQTIHNVNNVNDPYLLSFPNLYSGPIYILIAYSILCL